MYFYVVFFKSDNCLREILISPLGTFHVFSPAGKVGKNLVEA